MSKHLFAKIFLAAAIIGISASVASAEDKAVVADEYRNSCQVCHGADGTGNGPMAGTLTVKPSDLTQLSRKHDGKFPFLKVFQVIDGRSTVVGHGTREMPIWGQRYSSDVGEKYGPYGSEAAVRARMLELVYYVQSMQK